MIHYSPAQEIDIEAIANLLKTSNLPFSDIKESPINFIVAKDEDKLVGCIGVETYGTEGLLRSFAVENSYRSLGIGKALYDSLITYSTQNNIKTLHLLTNTAKDYFAKTGFSVQNRNKAPQAIQKTAEFAGMCPSSSTYMTLDDIGY